MSSSTNPEIKNSNIPTNPVHPLKESKILPSNSFLPVKLGTLGYFSLLLWFLSAAMLVSIYKLPWVVLLSIIVALLFYPYAFHRIFNIKWLFLLIIIAIPPIFFLGSLDRNFLEISYSSFGAQEALRVIMRFVIILVAISGFTETVDISAIAGLLERFGFRGLGFSIGVALNILPALQQSSTNAWQSLWLRGGFRKHRFTGLKYLLTNLITNALQQAENIALAAETRAFNPTTSQATPIQKNRLDYFIITVSIASLIWFML